MNRRKFIFTTAFTTLAAKNLLAGSYERAFLANDYLSLIDAEQRNLSEVLDLFLKGTLEKETKSWKQIGYKEVDNRCFVIEQAEGGYVFIPLLLEVKGVGEIDQSLLVFGKTKSKAWEKICTLPGGFLTSIKMALPQMQSGYTKEQCREFLLPIEASIKDGLTLFQSQKGKVEFKSRIGLNQKEYTLAIFERDKLLMNFHFSDRGNEILV